MIFCVINHSGNCHAVMPVCGAVGSSASGGGLNSFNGYEFKQYRKQSGVAAALASDPGVYAAADADSDTVSELALAEKHVRRFIADREIRKTIVVPGRLVNVVV